VPVAVRPGLEDAVIAEALLRVKLRHQRHKQMRAEGWRATPATFAAHLSNGLWRPAPHLNYISDCLVEAEQGLVKGLIIMAPPRHGKSTLDSLWFPAWYLDRHPDRRVMLATYEAEFAAYWGRLTRNTLQEHEANLCVKLARDSTAANRWDTTRGGGMFTAGVGGAFSGRGANVLIINDPIKNAAEATSATIREKQKEWYESTASTRLEPGGVVIIDMARWHEDDLAGWLMAEKDLAGWRIIRFPALAEADDPLGRAEGEALWPERYNREALEAIRSNTSAYWWNALYQQRPAPREGGIFKRAGFTFVDALPAEARWVRYWDCASTASGGDWSVGALLGMDSKGQVYVADVLRGQWGPGERKAIMLQTLATDAICYPGVMTWVEQEGGSSGKEVAESMVRAAAGYALRYDLVTGSKEVRAEPLAAQVEVGNVALLKAPWNRDFIDELAAFPNGPHDDQVDAASGAFNKLTAVDGQRVGIITYEDWDRLISPF